MQAVFESGAGLVCNVPIESDVSEDESLAAVAVLGRLLGGGALSHGSLYGSVFHVMSTTNANNIANTTVALGPHQDLAYHESKPGLQLLHCISNEGIHGGESTLIDAMAAAEAFRHLAPMHFQTLSTCPATFVKQRDGADMMYRHTHIVVDDDDEIVSVSWSPPFEGPLCVAPDLVMPYYNAYAAFEQMLDKYTERGNATQSTLANQLHDYANKHTWERRLERGEILVFNNLRMLHGRRGFSFEGDSGDRHLMGCYTNIDDTLNRFRVLLRDRSLDTLIPNAGNGSGGLP